MGGRMATHLQRAAGIELTVWNRGERARQPLVALAAKSADSAVDAVAEAELVLTMLSDPGVVEAVMLDGGVLDAMPQGAVWADCSTVDPAFTRRCSEVAGSHGIRYLGTPVAGTRGPAEEGTLKVLVGGPKDVLEDARPALEAFSAGVIHVGEEVDRGAAFKLLVNGMLGQSMLVFAETLKLGVAQGLDREFLLKALPGLPVIAPFVGAKVEAIRAGDYSDVHFPLELMHKDLALLVQTAYEVGQPAFLASVAREVYGQRVQDTTTKHGRMDFAAVAG